MDPKYNTCVNQILINILSMEKLYKNTYDYKFFKLIIVSLIKYNKINY